jgi:hypothetical protein
MTHVIIFLIAFGIGLGCGVSDRGWKHDEPDA